MFDAFAEAALTPGAMAMLVVALVVALGFEFVNGFHDTANAVATVIYTKTLPAIPAVIFSGICNFLGVFVGGIAVAIAITRLLPVELVVASGTGRGLAMVGALLVSAILWNLATWYKGLPASSSHTLIGAILGVGIASSALDGHFGEGVSWSKAIDVFISLLVSPLFGFGVAALLLFALRRVIDARSPIFRPAGDVPPSIWIRALLVLTCGGVSFAHGSNDGQKGVGLMMLILVGIVPAGFALNLDARPADVHDAAEAAGEISEIASLYTSSCAADAGTATPVSPDAAPICLVAHHATVIAEVLAGHDTIAEVSRDERWRVREGAIRIEVALRALAPELPAEPLAAITAHRATIARLTDYAPTWVLVLVALALGIGTTVGWRRIVVTVGEKIGKTHLTYAQGASAELVAMSTIGVSAWLGLPVSTTHVLSSGIAGTMVMDRSGLQAGTVRNIAIAWLLTLPATMLLSGLLFVLFAQLAR